MNSNLNIQLQEAYKKANSIEERLAPDTMLKLYAYYKQATQGDITLSSDSETDLRNGFKFNAWAQLKGMSVEEAKIAYINLFKNL